MMHDPDPATNVEEVWGLGERAVADGGEQQAGGWVGSVSGGTAEGPGRQPGCRTVDPWRNRSRRSLEAVGRAPRRGITTPHKLQAEARSHNMTHAR
jgi:hypothetical protein